MKVFLDTNIFVYGLRHPKTNSRLVLDHAEASMFQTYVSELVIQEMTRVFKAEQGEQDAYYAVKYAEGLANVIPRNSAAKEEKAYAGKIADKDLQNLAAAIHEKADRLISYDRHYEGFRIHRTPKEFIKELKQKPYETEY